MNHTLNHLEMYVVDFLNKKEWFGILDWGLDPINHTAYSNMAKQRIELEALTNSIQEWIHDPNKAMTLIKNNQHRSSWIRAQLAQHFLEHGPPL